MRKTPALLLEGLSFASLEARIERPLWTPGPAWAMTAGALACGAEALLGGKAILRLLTLVFLVDPIWGGMWRMALRWPGEPGRGDRSRGSWGIPYLQSESPAHRVAQWLDSLQVRSARSSGLLQAFLLSLAMGLILSAGMGKAAVLATLIAALAAIAARVLRGYGWLQGVVLSASQFALPWALAVKVFGGGTEAWILGGLWAATHVLMTEADAGLWYWKLVLVGQVALVAWFVWLRQPVVVALLTMAFLPTWMSGHEVERQRGSGAWWAAALLVSSIALNFR